MAAAVEKMTRRKGTVESWHGEENETDVNASGFTLAQWAENAGLGWKAHKEPLYVKNEETGLYEPLTENIALVRDMDRRVLGIHSNQYEVVQPIDTLEALDSVISVDNRFKWETAGSLDGGRKVFALATFEEEREIIGEKHKPYLLASTSFDGSMATTLGGTQTRVVCMNTLRIALGSRNSGLIRLKHRTEWNEATKAQAMRDLENVVKQFDTYKNMAEALAGVRMSKEIAHDFLRKLIFTPKLEEVETADGSKVQAYSKPSTRSSNLMDKLIHDYEKTVDEGTDKNSAWTVFNAITRYADHSMGSRLTKNKEAEGETKETVKLESNLFGGSDKFKQEGLSALLAANDIKVKELIAA